MEALIPIILNIVHEGIKLWSEERRTRFYDEHHEILEEIEDARNKVYPEYNDADLALAKQRLRIYLQSYWRELQRHGVETLQQGKG